MIHSNVHLLCRQLGQLECSLASICHLSSGSAKLLTIILTALQAVKCFPNQHVTYKICVINTKFANMGATAVDWSWMLLFCPFSILLGQRRTLHYVMFLIFNRQQLWSNNQEPDPRAASADHQRVRGGDDQPHGPRQEVELQRGHHQDVGQEGRVDPPETVQEIHLSRFWQLAREGGHGV